MKTDSRGLLCEFVPVGADDGAVSDRSSSMLSGVMADRTLDISASGGSGSPLLGDVLIGVDGRIGDFVCD
jgi:hypothetical protein